jgi:predicted DNA-binding antitoxin AbrB/MazE fold protein
MLAVEAVYQGGVFKPVGEVHLPENQRVLLDIRAPAAADVAAWLAAVRDLHHQIVSTRGHLPDSTPDIAADRVRDD